MYASLKWIALAGCLVSTVSQAQNTPGGAATPPAVATGPEDAAKHAAAERYLATLDENANFERLIAMLAGALRNPEITDQQRADFVAYARAHLDRTVLQNAMISAMMQTYTLPELTALSDFYGSPVGREISAKSQSFQITIMQMFVPVAVGFMQDYAKQCTDKSKCIDLSTMAKK